jgi:hypothetical protein
MRTASLPVRSPREEMESRLRSEILTLGFLVATVVTDSAFFYRQDRNHALLQAQEWRRLSRDTNHRVSNIVLWERGVISDKFARGVYDLLYACNDLKPFFKVMFKDEGPMGDLISSLLESRVPRCKVRPFFDILPKERDGDHLPFHR